MSHSPTTTAARMGISALFRTPWVLTHMGATQGIRSSRPEVAETTQEVANSLSDIQFLEPEGTTRGRMRKLSLVIIDMFQEHLGTARSKDLR
jgi:hypothetical protein